MMFFLVPITFLLGWYSRYTVVIDRGIIAATLFTMGFTPLFSLGFSNFEGAPDFRSRDFIGPWLWLFNELSVLSQVALILAFVAYFLGKLGAFIYLVSNLPD